MASFINQTFIDRVIDRGWEQKMSSRGIGFMTGGIDENFAKKNPKLPYIRRQRGLVGSAKSFLSGPGHTKAMEWMGFGKGQKLFGRVLGLGFTGLSAVQGFQEGGVFGAASSVGSHYLLNRAFIGAIGSAKALGGVALGGAAIGGMMFGLESLGQGRNPLQMLARPYTNEYMKKHAKLEMSTPIKDDFGTVSTMRQRSLQAIGNSRLNGRTALGNEAALMYTPYMR